MNILHITAGDLNGGAARGAYWLHQGLLNLGVDSKMLINAPDTLSDPTVETVCSSSKDKILFSVRYKIDQLPVVLYKNRQKNLFSPGWRGYDITKHPLYGWADIIHLHWINGAFINLKTIARINKPIVWTMRDMWPFTGGCHYSLECERYKKSCGACMHLGSKSSGDLSRQIVMRKLKDYPKHMKVFGISNWLSQEARESSILSGYDIGTISNNINSRDFFPIEKKMARDILGVDTNKKIVLVGAQGLNDHYKGFDKYLEAIKLLNKENVFLSFFGKLETDSINRQGFEYKNFGFLHDTISLRMLYSAADVFVAPSIMDAFGKTLAEAMACGTPVVCFDATGPKDIVDHQLNGYRALPFDSKDLANGINWILDNPSPKQLAESARKKVVASFDSMVIAKKYKEVYSEIVTAL